MLRRAIWDTVSQSPGACSFTRARFSYMMGIWFGAKVQLGRAVKVYQDLLGLTGQTGRLSSLLTSTMLSSFLIFISWRRSRVNCRLVRSRLASAVGGLAHCTITARTASTSIPNAFGKCFFNATFHVCTFLFALEGAIGCSAIGTVCRARRDRYFSARTL